MYTSLPELWKLFNRAVSISAMSPEGLITLSALDTVLNYNDTELSVTYEEFWEAMSYFLNRTNLFILSKRRKANVNFSPH